MNYPFYAVVIRLEWIELGSLVEKLNRLIGMMAISTAFFKGDEIKKLTGLHNIGESISVLNQCNEGQIFWY